MGEIGNPNGEEDRKSASSPYRVGDKKPPLDTRFRPGKSGNPKGRPKGRRNFSAALLEEFCKPVSATMNGKPIRATNEMLFAASLVKDGITKGPQSKKLLLNAIQASQALADEMEAAKRVEAEKNGNPVFSWTEAQERLYQKLEQIAAEGHLRACPHCGEKVNED